MVTMYDAVTASNIPRDADVVAGYIDGKYAWSHDDWNLFPPSTPRITIAVFASTVGGHALDVEHGDATAVQSVDWVLRRRAQGMSNPVVYCSRIGDSTYGWPAVRKAFWDRGVKEPLYWIADYTGTPHLVQGSIATQYKDAGPYDMSITDGVWPFVPRRPAITLEVPDMQYVSCVDSESGGSWHVQTTDGGVQNWDGAPFLGNLVSHPEWHAVTTGHSVESIVPWKDGSGAMGYKIWVLFSEDGLLHGYGFPRDGSLAK